MEIIIIEHTTNQLINIFVKLSADELIFFFIFSPQKSDEKCDKLVREVNHIKGRLMNEINFDLIVFYYSGISDMTWPWTKHPFTLSIVVVDHDSIRLDIDGAWESAAVSQIRH